MFRLTVLLPFCFGTALSGGLPIKADVTASDVWKDTEALLSIYGPVTASQSRSGDTLRVSSIFIAGQLNAALKGELQFKENGDGSVRMNMPPALSASLPMAGGPPVTYRFLQTGMSIVATGDPGQIVYTFNAPSMTYAINGKFDGRATTQIDAKLSQVKGGWTSTGVTSEARTVDADYTADNMIVSGRMTAPNAAATNLRAELSTLAISTLNTVPTGAAALADTSMAALLDQGLNTTVAMRHGPMTFTMTSAAKGPDTRIRGAAASGTFSTNLNRETLAYSVGSTELDAKLSGGGIPFPQLDLRADTYQADLQMPLDRTDAPQDFSANMALRGMTVGDTAWAMLDPTRTLPRTPATVAMKLSGKGNWLVDIMDQQAIAANPATMGQINALTLDALEVSFAGAVLTGTGALTFESSGSRGPTGFPKPDGAVDLKLIGGLTLLDKLGALGLVPTTQVITIKTMAGLFAQRETGTDTLRTKVEFEPSGAIRVNGQRIQ